MSARNERVPALVLCALAALVFSVQVRTAEKNTIVAGHGSLIIGTFPNQLWIYDEATEKLAGSIPYKSGIPRRTTISRDGKRFYTIDATMEKLEVIDIQARKTLDAFTFSEGNRKVRIRSAEPDPLNRYVVMLTSPVTKLIDRVEIGQLTLVQYDLRQHKISHSIAWPSDLAAYGATIQFSPDGSKMNLFIGSDVFVYDTEQFVQVDKWNLARAIGDGFGSVELGSRDDTLYDEPGYYTGLFTVTDSVVHRRTMGIGHVNLAAKTVEFFPIGPAIPVGARGTAGEPLTFTLAPGRKFAFGLFQEFNRSEFWKFDLEHRHLAGPHGIEFNGRPRMNLKTSSNGKVLYIYTAGNTIDLWDAETYQYLHSITLPGDTTTTLFVLPSPPSPQTSTSAQ